MWKSTSVSVHSVRNRHRHATEQTARRWVRNRMSTHPQASRRWLRSTEESHERAVLRFPHCDLCADASGEHHRDDGAPSHVGKKPQGVTKPRRTPTHLGHGPTGRSRAAPATRRNLLPASVIRMRPPRAPPPKPAATRNASSRTPRTPPTRVTCRVSARTGGAPSAAPNGVNFFCDTAPKSESSRNACCNVSGEGGSEQRGAKVVDVEVHRQDLQAQPIQADPVNFRRRVLPKESKNDCGHSR